MWHLVSTVSARVPLDVPMAALLDAAFPPASVTGAPKTRARQLLAGWEPRRRGVYCGTVGLASPIAGCELNVAIRTVEFGIDGSAVLGVGGGITADSIPTANGTSACTRRRRSSTLRVPPAALEEKLGQQFRLADHQVVAGVHRQHGLHATQRGDRPALRAHRSARSRSVRIQVRGTSSGRPERSAFSKMMDGDSA